MTPFGVVIAGADHMVAQERLEHEGLAATVVVMRVDLGPADHPGALLELQAMVAADRAAHLAFVERVEIVFDRKGLENLRKFLPALGIRVFVLAPMGAAILPVDRRPQPEKLRGLVATDAFFGLAGPAPAPASVLGPVSRLRADLLPTAIDGDVPFPAAELAETLHLGNGAHVLLHVIGRFLVRDGVGVEPQIAFETAVVGLDHDPHRPHRLDDLMTHRPGEKLGAVAGEVARGAETVLCPVLADDRDRAVHHLAVGVGGEGNADVEFAVEIIAVVPVARVHVALGRGHVGERLGGLVHRIVVECDQHGGASQGDGECGLSPPCALRYRDGISSL